MHKVGVDEAAVTVLFALTVIVPVALTVPHPPDKWYSVVEGTCCRRCATDGDSVRRPCCRHSCR